MRTAEEIISKYGGLTEFDKTYKDYPYHIVVMILNEARKDAIQECARKADTRKQSILKLIKELK